jgi:hypothetical protein
MPKALVVLAIRAPVPFARAQPPSPSSYPALKHSIRRYILLGKNPGWTQFKFFAKLSLKRHFNKKTQNLPNLSTSDLLRQKAE